MMFFLKPTALFALLVTAVVASPVDLEPRQSATNCGGTAFTLAATRACRNAAYSYYQQGGTAGGSTYPHTFNNNEGFNFAVSGPYQEFPLIISGAYSGGAPGAHRCVISTSGGYAGAITHAGASGNAFVGCTGTST